MPQFPFASRAQDTEPHRAQSLQDEDPQSTSPWQGTDCTPFPHRWGVQVGLRAARQENVILFSAGQGLQLAGPGASSGFPHQESMPGGTLCSQPLGCVSYTPQGHIHTPCPLLPRDATPGWLSSVSNNEVEQKWILSAPLAVCEVCRCFATRRESMPGGGDRPSPVCSEAGANPVGDPGNPCGSQRGSW